MINEIGNFLAEFLPDWAVAGFLVTLIVGTVGSAAWWVVRG